MAETSAEEKVDFVVWKPITGGVILGLFIFILFFEKLFCFYAYDPSGKILFGALTGVGALIAFIVKPLDASFQKTSSIKASLFFILGSSLVLLGGIFLSPFFMSVEMNACVHDFDQLVDIVHLEEKAVMQNDLALIEQIYDTNAIVLNAETQELFPAYLYYSQKLAKEEHCATAHFDFQVESYTRDQKQVSMTTGSQGSWGWKGQGCTNPFYNPAGTDQWNFIKTEQGWKISHFSFNNQ